jgi:dolichol-phosphate mannosyltransferase
VVRAALGIDAKTVSSFFRVYRASVLREAFAKHGDQLIRESGFACKAEILAKLAAMNARIVEEPVELDWSRRVGESKMPLLRTMLGYGRILVHSREAAGAAEVGL